LLVTEKNINVQPEKNAFTYVIPKTDMRLPMNKSLMSQFLAKKDMLSEC